MESFPFDVKPSRRIPNGNILTSRRGNREKWEAMGSMGNQNDSQQRDSGDVDMLSSVRANLFQHLGFRQAECRGKCGNRDRYLSGRRTPSAASSFGRSRRCTSGSAKIAGSASAMGARSAAFGFVLMPPPQNAWPSDQCQAFHRHARLHPRSLLATGSLHHIYFVDQMPGFDAIGVG